MIKTTAIDEFKIGQKVYGFYQSIFKEKKISKHGDYYIDILLRDKTGQINGKIWNFIDFYDSVFNEGDLVSVKGEIKRYRKKLFIEIDNISFLDFERYKKYGFEDKNIYPSIDVSPDIIFNRIIKLIKKLDNPYKNLLLNIYNHYKDKIKLYPDDISLFEYNKKGSLILKIYNTLKIAASIHKNKSQNDKNMINTKILINITLTFLSFKIILNPFFIVSAFAFPPTSRKFAGSPPDSFIISIVAIASPAPFTIHPTLPSSLT